MCSCFDHIVLILTQSHTHTTQGADESDSNKENELGPPLVSTPLPSPLPLSCPNLHLHQSRSVGDADPHKLVKAMYSEQVLYRLGTNS